MSVAALEQVYRSAGPTPVKWLLLAAVVGASLMLAIPAGRDFLARSSVVAGADELLHAFHAARMEALARKTQVTICKSARDANGKAMCADGAAEWPEGWVVFVDHGVLGRIDPADTIISTGRVEGSVLSVTEKPRHLAAITFHPVGPITGSGGPLEIHLSSASTRGMFERVICLSILGRAHLAASGACPT